MDKFKSAFEILYILSCADGEVSKSEVQIIVSFLNSNYYGISFTPSEVIDSIDNLTSDGIVEELGTAVTSFKNSSSAMERTTLMKFAIQLVASDGHMSEGEKWMLHAIANTLNFDLNTFIAKNY